MFLKIKKHIFNQLRHAEWIPSETTKKRNVDLQIVEILTCKLHPTSHFDVVPWIFIISSHTFLMSSREHTLLNKHQVPYIFYSFLLTPFFAFFRGDRVVESIFLCVKIFQKIYNFFFPKILVIFFIFVF